MQPNRNNFPSRDHWRSSLHLDNHLVGNSDNASQANEVMVMMEENPRYTDGSVDSSSVFHPELSSAHRQPHTAAAASQDVVPAFSNQGLANDPLEISRRHQGAIYDLYHKQSVLDAQKLVLQQQQQDYLSSLPYYGGSNMAQGISSHLLQGLPLTFHQQQQSALPSERSSTQDINHFPSESRLQPQLQPQHQPQHQHQMPSLYHLLGCYLFEESTNPPVTSASPSVLDHRFSLPLQTNAPSLSRQLSSLGEQNSAPSTFGVSDMEGSTAMQKVSVFDEYGRFNDSGNDAFNMSSTSVWNSNVGNDLNMPSFYPTRNEHAKAEAETSQQKKKASIGVDHGSLKPKSSVASSVVMSSLRSSETSDAISFPSERDSLDVLSTRCDSPTQALRVLKILGSTLRCKADPFVDAAALPSVVVNSGKSKTGAPTPDPSSNANGPKSGAQHSTSFPVILYDLLEMADREHLDDVIGWLPHKRAFRINNKDRFMREILPVYLKGQTRWSSFLRQLNLYGFSRVAKGTDYGAYYHELMIGGRPDLCQYMRRVGTPKGLDRRTFKLAEGEDPNFYAMPLVIRKQDNDDDDEE